MHARTFCTNIYVHMFMYSYHFNLWRLYVILTGFPDIQSEEVVEAPDDYHGRKFCVLLYVYIATFVILWSYTGTSAERIDTPADDPSTDTPEGKSLISMPLWH